MSSKDLLENCTIDKSYFTITLDGVDIKNSFQEIDYDNLKLLARVNGAGTLTAHPRITCNGYEYPIDCDKGMPLC